MILRYDTIAEFNVDSKAENLQLNLAHVARKKIKKEETRTNKRQCPYSTGSRFMKAGSRELFIPSDQLSDWPPVLGYQVTTALSRNLSTLTF